MAKGTKENNSSAADATYKTSGGNLPKNIKGSICVQQANFTFSANHQSSGRYAYRGKVSVIGPDGSPICNKKTGKKISANLYFDASEDEKRGAVVLDKESVLKSVEESAEKILENNYDSIFDTMNLNVRPDRITVYIAVIKYGRRYIEEQHGCSSPERQAKIFENLKKNALLLTKNPMSVLKPRRVASLLKTNKVSDSAIRELHRFWTFCIDNGLCSEMANPIKPPPIKKSNPETKILENTQKRYLSIDEENKLFDKLEKDPENPLNVAAALALSGFSFKEICNLRNSDVTVSNDSVIVTLFKEFSSTQNYSRPTVPRTSYIVMKWYRSRPDACKKDSDYFIPVNGKMMSENRLVNEITRMVKEIGIKSTDLGLLAKDGDQNVAPVRKLLRNTYERDIHDRCNLKNDGTADFLLGKSFSYDTTSSSYTAFTSPSGRKRLESILKSLQKPKKIKKTVNNDPLSTVLSPEYTYDYAEGIIELTVPPKSEFTISCKYGVEGVMEISKI